MPPSSSINCLDPLKNCITLPMTKITEVGKMLQKNEVLSIDVDSKKIVVENMN